MSNTDSTRTTIIGGATDEDYLEIKANGQQKGYVVLSDTERAKGYKRPFRDEYKHEVCGYVTTMARAIAETYAVDPKFYSGTFCYHCKSHFPVEQFVWTADGQVVGS